MGGLLNLDSMPLVGSVARLSNPGQMVLIVPVICNKKDVVAYTTVLTA